jgi:hypothetical protein
MRTAEAGGGFRGVVPPGQQGNPAGELLERGRQDQEDGS